MSDTQWNAEHSAALAAIDQSSQTYVGRWSRLVSQTNWEKGRIVSQWRSELETEGALPAEYSDEAWSRRVGGVSPQHVGRLRRVDQRFGEVWQEYEGLYWSHFQSALEWSDAEMWLEGAVQNQWSVSQMRTARWEAHGAPARLKPRDEDIVVAELDDDVVPQLDSDLPPEVTPSRGTVRDPDREETFEPDFGDPRDVIPLNAETAESPAQRDEATNRPFADLAELPADLAEAFEGFKLAVLRHKMDGWTQVARDDVLAALEGLKELALAP